jgi:valyl-tRNA synthetase
LLFPASEGVEDYMAKTTTLPTVYDPSAVEQRIYEQWMAGDYFRAPVRPGEKPFTIVIPPPNITGALHVGHALDNALIDALVRWQRMTGRPTLYLPGTDHASIATHAKIEETLAEQGTNRFELGRERFLEMAWAWRKKYGSAIQHQLRRLGCSCDWSRERFTMDEGLSRAVTEVFCRLYEEGVIYRGNYMVNWCPGCRSVISDIEVIHEERDSSLWHIAYPLADDALAVAGNGMTHIIVATTRPETMLGDTAVAVHPEDERYRALVGRRCVLPVMGRELPIIADAAVDPAFGSGAVKVTPAHDPSDYDMGRRHELESIDVIGPDLKMTLAAGKYAGMGRDACRAALLQELAALGLLRSTAPLRHAVGACQRCDTVIEPLISTQWFVRMQPLATPAKAAVRRGHIRVVPERFTRVYLSWLDNIRDWCISRQLWWGHRIPAYYCESCSLMTVAREAPANCPKCGGETRQDPDVLDTWFSSGLWPFSTLGWPEDTEDLSYFYPTTVLSTGYDILFFWVARMITLGLHFMGERPFEDVLIHGMVCDAEGRKMSKSAGNGIDPLDVVDRYGADACRYATVAGVAPGADTRFSYEKAEAARNFTNKLWNASRFVLMNLDDSLAGQSLDGLQAGPGLDGLQLELADRWMLSRLGRLVDTVTGFLGRYEIGMAAGTLHEAIWGEFCDWYIELAKARLYGSDAAARRTAQAVLALTLDRLLKLLHPIMPFITEEIWQALPHEGPSITVAPWPQADPRWSDPQAEADMSQVMDVIRAIRNIRAEMNVPLGKKADVIVQCASDARIELLTGAKAYLAALANVGELTVERTSAGKPPRSGSAILPGVEVYVPLYGLIDLAKETARLQKALDEAVRERDRCRAKLASPDFINRAPAEVVAKEREREAGQADAVARLEGRLALLRQ